MENTLYKYFSIDKGEFDEKDFTVTATATKEVVDRDGDIIEVNGIDLKAWKKNPVIMLFHDYHDFPIGLGVGKKAWIENKELKVKFKFLIDDNEKAFQAARLWKAGALKGLSIGFRPDYESVEFPEKRKDGASRIFKKVELLEISVVPIPSNREALMASVGKSVEEGKVDKEDADILESLLKEEPKLEENKELIEKDKKIEELEKKLKELELEKELEEVEVEDDYITKLYAEFEASGDTDRPDEDQIDDAMGKYIQSLFEEK